jgi:hypothetical protein
MQEVKKIGLAYIWHNRHENTNKCGTFLKEVYKDIQKEISLGPGRKEFISFLGRNKPCLGYGATRRMLC